MTRIRLLDNEQGIAVVEPGVTQRQLAAAVAGTPWMVNVTSSCADTSLIAYGDALATSYPDAVTYRRRIQRRVHCGDR